MTKFKNIEAARSDEKAKLAMAVVEFADGTFGLSKAMTIPKAMMAKHGIITIHPKAEPSGTRSTGQSAYSETVEGQAEARWSREERTSRIHN